MESNIKCNFCNKLYYKNPAKIKENLKLGHNNYCSKQCSYKARHTSINLPCMYCGLLTERTKSQYNKTGKIFCSSSCSASYHNPLTKIKEKQKCLHCNHFIPRVNSQYCSRECKTIAISKQILDEIQSGIKPGFLPSGTINQVLRKYLFKKYNNKCSECNWSMINSFTNKIPLEVYHIDGDYKNNKEDNLQLLCPNCHSLTKNYRSRNKSNNIRPKGNRGRNLDEI